MAANTSIIHRICVHATAASALPILASSGSNIAQATWSTAGYETIGSRANNGDDLDLDGGEISLPIERIEALVRPPRSQAPADAILLQNGFGAWEFGCYDMSEALHTLGSDISVGSNIAQLASSYTKRAVAIEVNGFAVIWFKQAILKVSALPGDFANADPAGAVKTRCMVLPLEDSTYPGGGSVHYYQ